MNTRTLTKIALMSALISVLSPLSIPLSTAVPISLATFAVMLAGGILGAKAGALSALIYLVIGFLGFPVFAGGTGGAGTLFGMTGGFLFGYVPLAYLTGLFSEGDADFKKRFAGMCLGNAVLYLLGTVWFMAWTSSPLSAALLSCVIPFLPGDLIKILLAGFISIRVSRALKESGNGRI